MGVVASSAVTMAEAVGCITPMGNIDTLRCMTATAGLVITINTLDIIAEELSAEALNLTEQEDNDEIELQSP